MSKPGARTSPACDENKGEWRCRCTQSDPFFDTSVNAAFVTRCNKCGTNRPGNGLVDARDEAIPTEADLREVLWRGHGHGGLYGDDGEMQCSACAPRAGDYKRASLNVLVRSALAALQEALRASRAREAGLTVERDRERDISTAQFIAITKARELLGAKSGETIEVVAGRAVAELEKLAAEVERLKSEVAFFAERLETQDHQYSVTHPAAARYRALREGLEKRAEAAEAKVARAATVLAVYNEVAPKLGKLANMVHDLREALADAATDAKPTPAAGAIPNVGCNAPDGSVKHG